MSDPVIEAAQRAWESEGWGSGNLQLAEGGLATAAACEALKPIRAVLDKLAEDTVPPCDFATQVELFAKAINDLSPLVYSTEELANG